RDLLMPNACDTVNMPLCALSRGGASSCRSRTLHPYGVLGMYATSSGCCVTLHRPPGGMNLSRISVAPARMLGGQEAQLPQRATNEHNGIVLRGIQPRPTLRGHGEGEVQRVGL